MSILKVANVHFDSAGTNRLEYLGGNTMRVNTQSVIVTGNVKSSGLLDSSNRLFLIKDSTGTVVWGN